MSDPLTGAGQVDEPLRMKSWLLVGWAAALVPHEFSLDDPSAITGVMRKLPEFTPPGHFLHVFKIN